MTPDEQYEITRKMAELIHKALNEIYETEMAFFMCAAPMDKTDGDVAHYIANISIELAVPWMEETIDRFVNNEIIPQTQGNA